VIVAHIMGIPVEESLQLAPAAAVTVAAVFLVTARARVSRFRGVLGIRFRRGGRATRD
jgi:hypothetical protein